MKNPLQIATFPLDKLFLNIHRKKCGTPRWTGTDTRLWWYDEIGPSVPPTFTFSLCIISQRNQMTVLISPSIPTTKLYLLQLFVATMPCAIYHTTPPTQFSNLNMSSYILIFNSTGKNTTATFTFVVFGKPRLKLSVYIHAYLMQWACMHAALKTNFREMNGGNNNLSISLHFFSVLSVLCSPKDIPTLHPWWSCNESIVANKIKYFPSAPSLTTTQSTPAPPTEGKMI